MISIVTVTMRDEFLENVFQNYERQRVGKKELIIVLNNDEMDIKHWRIKAIGYQNVRIFQLSEQVSLGACLNFATEKARGDYIAKFDDDDYYGPYYLAHIKEEFHSHPDVSVVGKTCYYLYLVNKKALLLFKPHGENRFTGWVAGASLVYKKELFKTIQFVDLNRAIDWYFLQDCKNHNIKIYSTNKENFVIIRRDPKYHTWKKGEDDFFNGSKLIAFTDDYESIVATDS
ncbi:glycosyltransferase family 2 protein [Oceanobacillus piezotolerans]|uniref:Glycosyltransferase family 2 protein n=1 Tax=Oceanobacillus piezotolerans TaxID=2448030 RepID=A0A498DR24_9BACI|nr:glycosyltransferase family A protein [Oceanobacillus piezotolerans]RLL46919.1 glycosyltransferase family 2 protein [Oceanobacillus piezotolerans]